MLHWGSMLTILSTGKVARPAFILIRTIECKFLMSSCQGYPTHFFTNRKLMLSTFFENCCVKCHEFYCCCQAVSKSTKHPHLKPHFAVKRFCGIFHQKSVPTNSLHIKVWHKLWLIKCSPKEWANMIKRVCLRLHGTSSVSFNKLMSPLL